MKQPASPPDWRALDGQLGPDCLRIASYNLHGCVGHDGARGAERIARVIAELGCDTVGLQEVYGLAALEERLGMTAVLAVRYHDHSWPGTSPAMRSTSTSRWPAKRRG